MDSYLKKTIELLYKHLANDKESQEILAFILQKPLSEINEMITNKTEPSITEFIYICYLLDVDISNCISDSIKQDILWHKAEIQKRRRENKNN